MIESEKLLNLFWGKHDLCLTRLDSVHNLVQFSLLFPSGV